VAHVDAYEETSPCCKAIDMHAHIRTGERAKLQSSQGVPHNTGTLGATPDDMAQVYQRLDMMAVIFDVEQETRT
jgi:uncharacterized protein